MCATLTRPWPPSRTELICLLVSYIMDFIMRICVCIRYSDLFFHPIFFCISWHRHFDCELWHNIKCGIVHCGILDSAQSFTLWNVSDLEVRHPQPAVLKPGCVPQRSKRLSFPILATSYSSLDSIPTSSSQELQRKAEYRSLQWQPGHSQPVTHHSALPAPTELLEGPHKK